MPERLIDHPRRFWAAVAVVIFAVLVSVLISAWAIVTAAGAPDEAARRLALDNAATQLVTCQQRNRNALQNVVNTLVIVDGVLDRFDVPMVGRRAAAASAIDSLGSELQRGGSAGPRDCNADDRITAEDYPDGAYPPEPLIDADTGLPRRPAPTARPTP